MSNTIDIKKAFEVPHGIIINDAAGFFSGEGVPDFSAPPGSLYADVSTSRLHIKTLNNGWKIYDPGRIQYLMNSTIYNGQFVMMDTLVSGSHYKASEATEIIGFSWRNTYTGRSFDLEFYYSESVNPGGTFLYKHEVRNAQDGSVKNLGLLIPENNYLYIKYVDQGLNASDLSLTLKVR